MRQRGIGVGKVPSWLSLFVRPDSQTFLMTPGLLQTLTPGNPAGNTIETLWNPFALGTNKPNATVPFTGPHTVVGLNKVGAGAQQ